MSRAEIIPAEALQMKALELAAARIGWLLGAQQGTPPDLDAGLKQLVALGPVGLAEVLLRFGLAGRVRDTFLLAAAPDLGTAAAAAIGAHPLALQGRATPGLVAHVLGAGALKALAPQGLLAQAGLVDLVPGPGLAQRLLAVDTGLIHALHGHAQPGEALADALTALHDREGVPDADRDRLSDALVAAREQPGFPLIHLRLEDRLSAERLATAAFGWLGLRAFALDPDAIDLPPARIAAMLNRDLVLLKAGLVLSSGAIADVLADLVTAPLLIWGKDTPATRRPVAEFQPETGGDTLLTDSLRLSPTAQRDAVATYDMGLAPSIWATARTRAARSLDGLAQRIEPQASWSDLVLPDGQMDLLRQLAAFQKHRGQVLDDWGFRAKSARGLGLAALFSGPSGTGKTMAAEVVATTLGPDGEAADLYRVDLSAIVSKYIGETEKNMARIFDAAENSGVVLLFDEGEALFGKRTTDVKDSLDRHANTETAYLLQRLEAYSGCAIVTTNLKATVDEAFLRRFRFILDFPFPDAALRMRIWQVVFPQQMPVEPLDYQALSKLALAGGHIRSIAISAAFLAAGEGGPVRMSHIARAARSEIAKLGKPLPEGQLRALG
ncbi:ATP-binding protein [Roseovarius sp. M141]|uniref:ATP-binding protein n=1 Tax=Roseovarius sp. M141 TaxID=2583806 RepID=UPI0020CD0241|nr:ATP-binding protein [Roseovarius sp. M141]MCQ0091220.1 ATP-binding protein [Roseovarius sp. M141]